MQRWWSCRHRGASVAIDRKKGWPAIRECAKYQNYPLTVSAHRKSKDDEPLSAENNGKNHMVYAHNYDMGDW